MPPTTKCQWPRAGTRRTRLPRADARVTLRTRRPLIGKQYGMQPHNAMHALSTPEARRAATATQSKAVDVQLRVATSESGEARVQLKLTARAVEQRVRGWAIRPPPSTERYSPERVAYLTELFDWPDGQLNEHQAYDLFKKQFAADDGPYRRAQRLSRAQIKAWFGSEKARRKKAGAAAALRAALPDDAEGDQGGASGGGRGGRVGGRGGRGRGCGRGSGDGGHGGRGGQGRGSGGTQRGGSRGDGRGGGSRGDGRGGQKRRAAVLESASEANTESESEQEEESEAVESEYLVEDVLDVRSTAAGRREFLVQWKEYDGDATWEPEANLDPSLVRDYFNSQEEDDTGTAAPARRTPLCHHLIT
jgi:hypothetical protein